MIGSQSDSGTGVTLASSMDTPVTPPSMKWLDRRNPFSPMPADRMPATTSAARPSSRSIRRICEWYDRLFFESLTGLTLLG